MPRQDTACPRTAAYYEAAHNSHNKTAATRRYAPAAYCMRAKPWAPATRRKPYGNTTARRIARPQNIKMASFARFASQSSKKASCSLSPPKQRRTNACYTDGYAQHARSKSRKRRKYMCFQIIAGHPQSVSATAQATADGHLCGNKIRGSLPQLPASTAACRHISASWKRRDMGNPHPISERRHKRLPATPITRPALYFAAELSYPQYGQIKINYLLSFCEMPVCNKFYDTLNTYMPYFRQKIVSRLFCG